MFYDRNGDFRTGRFITMIAIVVGVFLLLVAAPAIFGYWLHSVASNEIAVKLYQNKPISVVGPGIENDFRPFADITDIGVQGISFCAEDPEVLIKDAEMRIGVRVCGMVRRPGLENSSTYIEEWARYRNIYTQDLALVGKGDDQGVSSEGLMPQIAYQAMKVCVGTRTFQQAAVGTARDELRQCVDEEMSKLADGWGGLIVENVTVPNIIISPDIQSRMDEIAQARMDTQKSAQQAEKATADGKRRLAEEQANIIVEQGRAQEDQRQRAITADLERKAIEAQTAVIMAKKTNELLEANKNLEIAEANRKVAEINAAASLAPKLAEASMYANFPAYVELLSIQAQAGALKATDKLFMLPQGTNPIFSFGTLNNPLAITPSP